MPTFAASAVFAPRRCPGPAALAVCAVLPLVPYLEAGAVLSRTDTHPHPATAQTIPADAVPVGLDFAGTATAPHPSMHIPVTQGAASIESERSRFYR